jgi:hypothetical protein
VRGDVFAGCDFDTEVVDAGGGVGVLEQHQLERRVRDREVGVAGPALVRLGGEQLGIELDGDVDVGHVQSELDT